MRKNLALGLALIVSACAGYHTVPPAGYSLATPRVERIAFDMDGDPYPQSNSPAGLAIPPQPSNRNAAFTLRKYYLDHGVAYDREILLDEAAGRISAGMRSLNTKRVVFIIKGFNNSYKDFDTEYAWMREKVIGTRDAANAYFVQVYWDAIYKGPRTFPVPLAYFADSLTYSNHAGGCGLRDILRRLPEKTDVTFLTHSRGAAVALSSISDPEYDRGIEGACKSGTAGHSLPTQLADVRLVAFAPAIGDGHLPTSVNTARTGIFAVLDRLYVGYNPNDPAVTKRYFGINLPDRYGGDTRLGGNEAYVRHVDGLLADAGLAEHFQYEAFGRKSHDWDQYVAMTKPAECLLWAGMLIREAPNGCGLTR